MRVDVNCDIGESFGAYTIGSDAEMMRYITSANIACGYHAGDPMVMDRTVRFAVRHGVQIGSHPGYPDLLGFGRRRMALSPEEIENYVLYQTGALSAFARSHGAELRHVKVHGALTDLAFEDLETARAVARGVARFSEKAIMVCLANTPMVTAARESGLRVAQEVYPDRGYDARGILQSRRMPGSVIHDPAVAVERALRMVLDGTVVAHTGETVRVEADTMCIHGDNPAAPRIAAALREALEASGIEVKPMAEFL